MGSKVVIVMCQLTNADATRALGRWLAQRLLERSAAASAAKDSATPAPPPLLLLLQGELGAGKTCLVQGLAEGLGISEPITSPTFALAHHYAGHIEVVQPVPTPASPIASPTEQPTLRLRTALVHLDLYRLEDAAAAVELFAQEEEEAQALNAVLAVEWPERLGFVPEPCWRVELEMAGEGRLARLVGAGLSDAIPPLPAP